VEDGDGELTTVEATPSASNAHLAAQLPLPAPGWAMAGQMFAQARIGRPRVTRSPRSNEK